MCNKIRGFFYSSFFTGKCIFSAIAYWNSHFFSHLLLKSYFFSNLLSKSGFFHSSLLNIAFFHNSLPNVVFFRNPLMKFMFFLPTDKIRIFPVILCWLILCWLILFLVTICQNLRCFSIMSLCLNFQTHDQIFIIFVNGLF